MRLLLVLALVGSTLCLSGCAAFDDVFDPRPDYAVERSAWRTGEWTRDPVFLVRVNEVEEHEVTIEATGTGQPMRAVGRTALGQDPVTLQVADGTWTVTYSIDGREWETIKGVLVDATAPSLTGLPAVADATDGAYTLGAGATVEPGAMLQVIRQRDQAVVATSLPLQLTGLADGIHAYDIVATDEAGNDALRTVVVRVGDAVLLPDGQFTFGIVARFTQELALWDLSDMDQYLGRPAAQAATKQMAPNGFLGTGQALTPDDPAIQAVVAEVVQSGDNTMEAALALFEWMVDHTDYDQDRLASKESDLQTPVQTIERAEGVCRDLAALYASLLRGAGVPARIVVGYVGAQVGGFHAWVEFYAGGNGPAPWVPVDVSFDGDYSVQLMLQAFALRPTHLLAMYALPEAQEAGDWYTAGELSYRYPGGQAEPTVELEDQLTTVFEQDQVLCIDQQTLDRRVAARAQNCNSSYFPDFPVQTQRVLDYGVRVSKASSGSEVTVTLTFPESAEAQTYGATFTAVPGEPGRRTATWDA